MKCLLILILLISTFVNPLVLWADEQPLWKGLISEATSDGYEGLYAVCCVVRNRLNAGMSTGLVGLKRKDLDDFVRREGKDREIMAKEIIYRVFERRSYDITKGATNYENIEKYGKPYWLKNMVKTIKIGEHQFFRGVKNGR